MLNENNVMRIANTVAEGSYSLSEMEQKLLVVIILSLQDPARVKKSRVDNTTILAENVVDLDLTKVKELLKLDNSKGAIQRLKLLLFGMAGKHVSFVADDGTDIDAYWFSSILTHKGTGYMGIEIPTALLPYLYDLRRRFVAVGISTVLALGGKYTFRLYLLLKSHAYKNIYTCELTELHSIIDSTESYAKNFSLFNNDILSPAIAKINKLTELTVTMEYRKAGKKVVGLTFRLVDSAKANKVNPADVKILTAYNVSEKRAKQFLEKYLMEPTIREALKVVNQYRNTGKAIDNIEKFLTRALKEDWKVKDMKSDVDKSLPPTDGKRGTEFDGTQLSGSKRI